MNEQTPQFIPILDRVILEEVEKRMDYGAVIVADIGKERIMHAKVIAKGPGLLSPFTGVRSELQCSINDIVIFQINRGIELNIQDKIYYAIKESDIETIIAYKEDKNEE